MADQKAQPGVLRLDDRARQIIARDLAAHRRAREARERRQQEVEKPTTLEDIVLATARAAKAKRGA